MARNATTVIGIEKRGKMQRSRLSCIGEGSDTGSRRGRQGDCGGERPYCFAGSIKAEKMNRSPAKKKLFSPRDGKRRCRQAGCWGRAAGSGTIHHRLLIPSASLSTPIGQIRD